jgi:hypothetical protein
MKNGRDEPPPESEQSREVRVEILNERIFFLCNFFFFFKKKKERKKRVGDF